MSLNTIKSIQSEIAAIHKNSFLTTKIELMWLNGLMNFYSNFFDKQHVIMKPLCDLLYNNFETHRNKELETLF